MRYRYRLEPKEWDKHQIIDLEFLPGGVVTLIDSYGVGLTDGQALIANYIDNVGLFKTHVLKAINLDSK